MATEILVNVTLREVRVALASQGLVREIQVERRTHKGVTGNIYSGQVRRLLPGLQAAFIEMGLSRPGFLHARDIDAGEEGLAGSPESVAVMHLHPSDRLPVQVIKDPLGTKGARLTTCFTLPGRLLVLTPGVFRMAVSQKLTDQVESSRLLSLLQPGNFGGYIFRTLARDASPEAILAEQRLLDAMWAGIVERMASAKPGTCLHTEPALEMRILRDVVFDAATTRICVDDGPTMVAMKKYAATWFPALVDCIRLHEGVQPIFEEHGIEKVLKQALQRKLPLKSGGHLVFDQTEAMTTIDVNSGSSLSVRRAEETVFRTNQEAVAVIAHQVRLRNLGGIIIIDFIDMTDMAQRQSLLESLEKAFAEDPARTEFSELTRLGLVQMTRKRARESLLHTLCNTCPLCQRRGMIRSPETVAHDILRAMPQMVSRPWSGFRIQVAPEVAGYLLEHEPEALTALETRIGRTVELCADSRYGQETWDILPLDDENQTIRQ